jgi:hypothetical protein
VGECNFQYKYRDSGFAGMTTGMELAGRDGAGGGVESQEGRMRGGMEIEEGGRRGGGGGILFG